jgi:hypothetical protein
MGCRLWREKAHNLPEQWFVYVTVEAIVLGTVAALIYKPAASA